MRRYETFNPTIPEEQEPLVKEVLPEYNQEQLRQDIKPQAKPVNKKRNNRNSKANDQKKAEPTPRIKEKVVGFFTNRTLRWIVGIFLALFGVYLAIAFISYFTTCVNDQSEINNTAIGYSSNVANAAGEGGARLSAFLIDEFFGVGSFVIIIWLLAVGLRILTGKPRFKAVNFTIKCLVALITVSLIVGLLTLGSQTTVNWGGYHGRYANEFIIHFLGWSGAIILCIFMVCCFVIICLRDIVKWVLIKKATFDQKRRERKAKQEEMRARERELEEMRQEEDQEGTEEESGNKDVLPEETGEESFDFKFDAGENVLYNEIPELEDSQYSYVLNETDTVSTDNLTEEKNFIGAGDEKEKVDGEIPEEHLKYLPSPDPNTGLGESEINEEEEIGSSESKEKETDQEISTSEIQPGNNNISESDYPSETKKEDGNSSDLNMVVNVNTISQVNGKSQGVGTDSPEHFPYKFPSFEILTPGSASISVDPEEQFANKERIKRTLADFDIPIVSIEATVGPTVTLYEVVPDKGIRVAKIRSLVDDIALSLAAEGIRIIAPIPGKGTVGIEVANNEKQTVSMRTVLKSPAFQNTKYKLPIALGSTISNEVYMADLAKMPHLLVAGATGQGKSVGLNAIITSLLYSKRPDELKFVLIDPKMVEFSLYAKIEGHYLAKIPEAEDAVITDMDKVKATLTSLCIEMDNRYQLLKEAATKNIIEYNEKIKAKKLNPNDGHKFMPYIVVIVDEFSDLIMTAGKEVEVPIARLAQKARAVGMHVIIATQRPSANVITGIIKANFPARMAFKVSSGVDSKTILDTTGAQQLIGRGDMLVSNSAPMVRVQCAFIDTPEVEKVADHIAAQPYQQGAYLLPEPLAGKGENEGGTGGGGNPDDRDSLFEEVARLVVQTNVASTSSIQRRYRIGYNRAGSIMDQLEVYGIVGPAQGGKARSVLMDMGELERLLDSL